MKTKVQSKIASISNLLGNIFLFVIKITSGLIFSSMAMIGDAINSLSDILSSAIIHYSIKVSSKDPDENHPFGHSRSEPIAALISALIMWVLAFQIFQNGMIRIINKETLNFSPILVNILIFTMILKFFLFLYSDYVSKKEKSPGLKAGAYDNLNDILISLVALIVILLNHFLNIYWFDTLAGFIIAAWIIRVGYKLLRENIDYLMGKKPDKKLIEELEKEATNIQGVKGLNDVFAQYLGSLIQLEIHIEVDKKLNIEKAHKIGKEVKLKLEKRQDINNVFVHIDPK